MALSKPKVRSKRWFVPDLSPADHPEVRGFRPQFVFVAESPHVSEIAPEKIEERRPLCGKAGQQWWGLLQELLESRAPRSGEELDLSEARLSRFCKEHQIAVMNAVQYPLDPKVASAFPEAVPSRNVGFSKAPGPDYYKKAKGTLPLQQALDSLKQRLSHPSVAACPVYCLGNDSEWLVAQALGKEEFARRVKGRIPHPSAWWRQGGLFGRIAREKLTTILSH